MDIISRFVDTLFGDPAVEFGILRDEHKEVKRIAFSRILFLQIEHLREQRIKDTAWQRADIQEHIGKVREVFRR